MNMRQRSIDEELHLETDLMKQSTDPKAELVTKRHLVTSIQLVYKLQNENWVRWPHYSRNEWNRLMARLMEIFTYYEQHKEVIA